MHIVEIITEVQLLSRELLNFSGQLQTTLKK